MAIRETYSDQKPIVIIMDNAKYIRLIPFDIMPKRKM